MMRDVDQKRHALLCTNNGIIAVRDGDTVKHYRIRQLDEGGFFIARKTTFQTLQELVDHYSRGADGLCVNLQHPCLQVRQMTSACFDNDLFTWTLLKTVLFYKL